ncbi:archaeoflavoprotein AfpA [Methanosarcinales archaeon]|nr:archaeoflavoprotein AfpA [Candidatus Syntrophoarchaeum sp.]RKY26560.1 MAG: archaeoflavoprotein AfpA [Candidatus Omnitrophota bacterium]RLG31978.1 MAG: archaeoflavoprotein AfpA [Methanosarcinales archaeon]
MSIEAGLRSEVDRKGDTSLKIAWGITGSGDRIEETVEFMEQIKERYNLDIVPYASKEGEVVLKFYKLLNRVKEGFPGYKVERSSNAPFLAAKLQMGEYDLFIICPATANTVAKIAHGIADSLLSNSAAQAMKVGVPVYIYPVDQKVGEMTTILPDGREMKLKIREEDVKNTDALRDMEGMTVLNTIDEIEGVVSEWKK